MMGYGVQPDTMQAIYNHLQENPIYIPAQELDYIPTYQQIPKLDQNF